VPDPEPAARARDRLLAVALATLGPADPVWMYVGDSFFLAGGILDGASRYAEACLYFQSALEAHRRSLGETNSRVLATLAELSNAHLRAGQPREAETVTREWVELLRRVLPADHWSVAVCEGRLGWCLLDQGRREEALTLMRGSLDRVVAEYGWTHRSVRATLVQTVRACDELGLAAEAADARRTLAGALARHPFFGPRPDARVAVAGQPEGFWELVEELRRELQSGSDRVPDLLDRVLAERRARFQDTDEFAALFADQMYRPLNLYINKAGFNEHSLRAFRALLPIARANEFLHIYKRAGGPFWVSWNLEVFGEHEEGAALALESVNMEPLAARSKSFGAGGIARGVLGGHLASLGRSDEAEPWLVDGFERLLGSLGPSNANTWYAWGHLSALYASQGRSAELAPWLRRVLDTEPPAKTVNVFCWRVVKHPGLAPSVYELALEGMCRAHELAPDDAGISNTLGVAEYRAGRFEEAIVSLRRSGELRRGTAPEGIAEDHAFMAMALCRLGRLEEARTARARLQALLGSDPDAGAGLRQEVDHTFAEAGAGR
jgi:tetratricopeptide (TPR) repeat protein